MGASLLYLLVYVSIIVFVVMLVRKGMKYASTPIHLRWELYPVAHEAEHGEHGGSYFENLDWWTKPIKKSLIGELKAMIPEMLWIKTLYEHNRSMWYFSFPFHLGLYLLIGLLGLLFIGGIFNVFGAAVAPGSGGLTALLYYLTIGVGFLGLTLATAGCIGLLAKRLSDEKLRQYTAFKDFFNLAFILLVLLSWLFSWLFVDHGFGMAREFVSNLIAFKVKAGIPSAAVGLQMALLALLLSYMPFTHMMHFLAKYFTFHRVLWEDEPNLVGSKLEGKVKEVLSFPVSWSAPHIKGDGKKTWAEVVNEEIEE